LRNRRYLPPVNGAAAVDGWGSISFDFPRRYSPTLLDARITGTR